MALGSWVWRAPGGISARWTGRSEGDLGPGSDSVGAVLDERRRAVLDRPWSWLQQVHGAGVVIVHRPGDGAGRPGDGLVSNHAGTALAVFTADCAPVALASPEGVFGAVHAGWRGVRAGVLQRSVEAMIELGATHVVAALGPCIGPECYSFGPADLDGLAACFGPAVRAVTSDGQPAFDLRAAVVSALAQAAVTDVDMSRAVCTACSPDHYSYRARADTERQALVVWPS